eukprot:215932-Hanusia_phi.AAC.1
MRRKRKVQTRQDKTRQDKTRQDKTRQSKARQGKARQDKARQGKARQDKTSKQLKSKGRSMKTLRHLPLLDPLHPLLHQPHRPPVQIHVQEWVQQHVRGGWRGVGQVPPLRQPPPPRTLPLGLAALTPAHGSAPG